MIGHSRHHLPCPAPDGTSPRRTRSVSGCASRRDRTGDAPSVERECPRTSSFPLSVPCPRNGIARRRVRRRNGRRWPVITAGAEAPAPRWSVAPEPDLGEALDLPGRRAAHGRTGRGRRRSDVPAGRETPAAAGAGQRQSRARANELGCQGATAPALSTAATFWQAGWGAAGAGIASEGCQTRKSVPVRVPPRA